MTAATKPQALLRLPLKATSFPELIAALGDVVDGLLGWRSSTGVFLFDEQREVVTLMPGSFGLLETPVSYPYASSVMQSRRVLASGRPFFSNDFLTDELMATSREALTGWGIHRVLILPLEAAGDRIGVLLVGSGTRPFTDSDVRAIEPSIPEITAAIEVAEALFAVRSRQRLEAVLGSVAVAIASAQDLSEFLLSSLDELCVAIDATLGTIVLADAAPIVWRAPAMAATAASDLLARVRAGDEVREELLPWIAPGDEGGYSGLQVPVWLGTELVGTLAIFRTYGEMFSSDDRHLLLRFGKLTALAWATERYQQQRAELARTEERARIADDLHDDVAQMLFAAQISLDSSPLRPSRARSARPRQDHARARPRRQVRSGAATRDHAARVAGDRRSLRRPQGRRRGDRAGVRRGYPPGDLAGGCGGGVDAAPISVRPLGQGRAGAGRQRGQARRTVPRDRAFACPARPKAPVDRGGRRDRGEEGLDRRSWA